MIVRAASLVLPALVSGSLQGCAPVVAAGVGAGVMMAQDRRSTEAYFDDQNIETRAAQLIDSQIGGVRHVNVTSFNYHVLISGEVPDDATRAQIEKIVSGIELVRGVSNELAVSPNSSLASRSDDSLITSSVKLRFMNYTDLNSDHIKVVTEDGTVYLMGLVKRAEAETAADIASTTPGAKRVVKIFEYQD
jgi:osmotically-inducible protein OsmY